MDVISLSAAQKYTDESIEGTVGVIAGKPCQVKSVEKIEGGNIVTFGWYDNDGLAREASITVEDGKVDAEIVHAALDKLIKILADSDELVSEDTPIGTVIAFMGNTPPKNYLACDGAEYSISAYQELADFIKAQFGAVNHFGGDGITTFAVPDLRGEFLRGTGTNGHAGQGSGEEVGEHQDATKHIAIYTYGNGFAVGVNGASGSYVGMAEPDSTTYGSYGFTKVNATPSTTDKPQSLYTSRPTNTSVNYCIKYKGTHYVKVNTYTNFAYGGVTAYSEEERCVGSWLNGKPLYQKTITGITVSKQGWVGIPLSDIDIGINNIDFGRVVNGFISPKGYDGSSAYSTPSSISTSGHITYQMNVKADKPEFVLNIYSSSEGLAANYTHTIVIEYTKATDAENSFTPDMLSGYDAVINFEAAMEAQNELIADMYLELCEANLDL